jgi:hypothetical protein
MDNRFFGWLSVCWGFFSSCLCFAAPAADEVRAAVEASPTVDLPPLGWRDPASGVSAKWSTLRTSVPR